MRTCAVGLNFRSGRPSAALLLLVPLVASAVVLGCGFKPAAVPPATGSGGTSGIDAGHGTGGAAGSGAVGALTSLSISPATATMTVTNSGPAQTQQYTVTGMINGQSQDLTTQVRYSTNPTGIVTIDANGLATSTGLKGGAVTVVATSGAQSATAKLTVSYTFTGADPGMSSTVPTDASSLFTTTTNDMSRSPQLIYPNDGVLFPPNITGIEIHFTPGANNTLFEVSLSGTLTTVNAIVRCTMPTGITTGCIYLMDPGLWSTVANGNAGLGKVSLVVRGTDDSGTSVGDSNTIQLQFSKDNIDGALYYWTTSGKSAIMRWDFAGSTQSAQAYLTPTNTDGKTCVGCHALAPDGSKLVASAGGQGDGRLLLWDIKNNVALQPFALTQRSQFESWNADGTQFVGMYGDTQGSTSGKVNAVDLMIFDGMTGMVTSTIALGGLRADHPDWSKNTDGPNSIVFTSSDATAKTTDQRPSTGGIDFLQYDGTAWQGPMQLVPSQLGLNRYYPSISPDGDLVVYDESTCTAGTPALGAVPDKSCNGDTDATATMFLISLKNGGTPTVLMNANKPGIADGTTTALTNSFPRWSPFISQLNEQQQLVWITFSSSRQYGLRPPPPPGTSSSGEAKTGTLIWMVGINPALGGGDPSYTAFCLPFQDVTTSNHIAQWAKYFLTGPG
jgi:hypothetical protein